MTAREDRARLVSLVERCESDLGEVAAERDAGDALAVELGGELVDRYRDDAASLAQIKPLGDEIRKLEAAGELPSTMVARSDRRKH